MLGVPMVFVRRAGCPINCNGCDTDYSVSERVSAREVARRAVSLQACEWVWLTGGEPTIHELGPLVSELRSVGFRVALATAGVREVPRGWADHRRPGGFDFVSVSPHFLDARWLQRRGDQLNIVPGLNGLSLEDVAMLESVAAFDGFSHKFVTPFWYDPAGRAERVAECEAFVRLHPNWRLGVQAHKHWNLP